MGAGLPGVVPDASSEVFLAALPNVTLNDAAAMGHTPSSTDSAVARNVLPGNAVLGALPQYDSLIAQDGDDGMIFAIALTHNPNSGSHYNLNSSSGAWWAKKIHLINKD